eukprot:Opistho-1_new@87150
MLMGQHGQAPVAHPGDLVHRARIAFDGATLAGGMGGLGLCLLTPLFRRTEAREHALLTLLALQREAQPVEDPARLLRTRAGDFRDALANAAPLGELLGRIDAGIIARHVFRALAGQGAGKLGIVLEVVAAIVKGQAVAVACHTDIAAMTVHAGCRQHMATVDGHALRLVDRGCIAMIDMSIILHVECDVAPVIGANGHALLIDLFDGAQRAVLHLKAALITQEHDAVPRCEGTIAAFGFHANIVAQFARRAHPVARGLVEFAHLGIGVSEDDPAGVGVRLPVAIPPLDKIAPGLFARLGGVNHTVIGVGVDRLAGSAGRKMPGSVLLPALMLAANLRNLDAAMPFVDRPERRTRLDGLQLLRVADQHDLGAGVGGMGQYALHLAGADHASLVDHQHIARREHVAPLRPTMFHAGDGARGDARAILKPFGCDARQRDAAHIEPGLFPCTLR